jgi:gliding-associated putative ABC transporter substrate-binding component GldG
MDDKGMHFREESVPTAMIVVADGDIIRNQIDVKRKTPLQLGYDQYTGNTYADKEFIENAISYLVDGERLIDIRSRELKIRLLDTTKVDQQRTLWQVVNTVVPIGLIIILGLVLAWIKKRKYSKK